MEIAYRHVLPKGGMVGGTNQSLPDIHRAQAQPDAHPPLQAPGRWQPRAASQNPCSAGNCYVPILLNEEAPPQTSGADARRGRGLEPEGPPCCPAPAPGVQASGSSLTVLRSTEAGCPGAAAPRSSGHSAGRLGSNPPRRSSTCVQAGAGFPSAGGSVLTGHGLGHVRVARGSGEGP